MGFLSPWILGGLAALGLPLWIHLLRRQTTRPLPFSSLMFFEPRTQSSVRHRRLRYLLLLGLRLALLALLVLAFANPFVTRDAPAAGMRGRTVLLAVDSSFSMREGDRMSRARNEALAALNGLGGADRAQVMAFDSQARLLTAVTGDGRVLRGAVETLRAGDSRSSYGELARALRSAGQAAGSPLEVHLFSDMQRSSLPAGFADLRLDAGTALLIHDVAGGAAGNWAVEGVEAPRRVFDGRSLRIRATVAGFGTEAARRTVSLSVNGRVVDSKTAEVGAGGRVVVELTAPGMAYGFSRCQVEIDAADRLREDDRHLFAVERAEPARILLVSDARERRAPLYYRTALESAGRGAYRLDTVETERAAAESLARYSVVVLSDVGAPGVLEQQLSAYVRGGGSLLVSLGPAAARRSLVPVTRDPIEGPRAEAAAGPADTTHPVFGKASGFDGVRFFRPVAFKAADADVIARFNDGTPLLVEKRVGEGRVLVFASTFDNVTSDFPLHASFVPFVERTAGYLAGAVGAPADFTVDAFVELRRERDGRGGVEVIGPAGGRTLQLAEAAAARSFRLSDAGFWEIRRANGRHELIGANPDRRESDLEPVPEETLALWRNTGRQAPLAQAGGGEPKRIVLGWYLLAAALAVAVAESLLASRYLSAAADAPPAARRKEAA